VTVAERGSPSMAESSPTRAPGERTASTASPPPAVVVEILTRPESSTSTQLDRSCSWNTTSPRRQARTRPRLRRSVASSSVSSPQNQNSPTRRRAGSARAIRAPGHHVRPYRLLPALDPQVAQRAYRQPVADRGPGGLPDHHLSRLGEPLQPGGYVHR